jgi:hypothetical protein
VRRLAEASCACVASWLPVACAPRAAGCPSCTLLTHPGCCQRDHQPPNTQPLSPLPPLGARPDASPAQTASRPTRSTTTCASAAPALHSRAQPAAAAPQRSPARRMRSPEGMAAVSSAPCAPSTRSHILLPPLCCCSLTAGTTPLTAA